MRFISRLLFSILFTLLLPASGSAKVDMAKYGVAVNAVSARVNAMYDSLLGAHMQLAHTTTVSALVQPHVMVDKTVDFYILLGLCVILGMIRLLDPKYFQHLWRAFRHPSLGKGQLKDHIESASLPGLLMNGFFTMMMGCYVYYVAAMFSPRQVGMFPPYIFIPLLMAGMMLIYLAKYLVIRFSGWAFRVEAITDYYTFNVFLINKMIGIVLLPFTILLAFADPGVQAPAVIVSFLVVGFLLLNRYTRSWQVLGSFFQYSKFHFFTYLCASELLPLAVLTKLLLR